MILHLLFFTLFCFSHLSAQQYVHPSRLKVVHTHIKNDRFLYKTASKYLHNHHRRNKLSRPSLLDLNIMAYKINEAYSYFDLATFYNNKDTKEFKHRLKAIKNACHEYGLNIQCRYVNNAYNLIYGAVTHCSYSKGHKKPNSWKHNKSKPLRTLNNTFVNAGNRLEKDK